MAHGFAHPGVHEIGDETQRRNGTPDPGVTVLDNGSHINAHDDRPGTSGNAAGTRPVDREVGQHSVTHSIT
jgi:hypothetical protein